MPRSPAAKWGQIVACVWYLGGFVALLGCTIAEVGPPAWVAAWQVRHWGADNPVLAFLPGFAVLLTPLAVVALLPRRADWPFVCGLQDGLWPRGGVRQAVLPRAAQARRADVGARVCLGLAAAALLAGGLGRAWVMSPGALTPGSALPVLTLSEASVPGAPLPAYARLADAAAQPRAAWVHERVVRGHRSEDAYVPLTGPGWRPGEAVAVLEDDRSGWVEPVSAPSPRPSPSRGEREVSAPAAREGSLARGLPAWMIGAMREAGLAVVDEPVVLTRLVLGGVVPGPDPIDAAMPLVFGGVFAGVLGLLALTFHRLRGRLLRDG